MVQDMMFLRVALLTTALVQGLLIPGSKGERVGYNNNYTDPQFGYVIGKVGNTCDDENQRYITFGPHCEKAVAAIQESLYMNLTYKGVLQDKDAQQGCIVDEEAKVVWLNEPVVTGEARSQDKGESKFSPLCEKYVCRTKIDGENTPMTAPCIFPFTYENVTYHKCVGNFLFPRLDGEQGICPVEVMGGDPFGNWYENKTQWGFCELKPRGECEKTEDIQPATTPAPECKYVKIEKTFEEEEKGELLAMENNISYSECESLCDNKPDCMNFEYCPVYGYGQPKMCRVFDAKIRGAEYLKQKLWFDCSAYYATCKKVQG